MTRHIAIDHQKLAELCEQARGGVPLREWADGSGVCMNTWWRIGHGGTTSIDNFAKIAYWLGIRPSTLMARVENDLK